MRSVAPPELVYCDCGRPMACADGLDSGRRSAAGIVGGVNRYEGKGEAQFRSIVPVRRLRPRRDLLWKNR
jgi:hypothetical protein